MRVRIVLLIFVSLFMFQINAQEEEQMDQQEMMKTWMEYMTPSEVHQHLKKSEGTWITDMKFWMAPNTEATVSKGEATAEMILGGRYLKMVHKGMTMGMEMEGISIESYDNGTKELTSIWIDNMGTGMMVMKGTLSEDMKTAYYNGTMYDPMSQTNIEVREVFTTIDENTQKLEMFIGSGDMEFKNMEIIYTRK